MKNFISLFSPAALGVELGGNRLIGGGPPAASEAVFFPFEIEKDVFVYMLEFINETTFTTGNVDIGIYDIHGTRLVSTGSTPITGTVGKQSIPLGANGVKLCPGNYYLALVRDNNDGGIVCATLGSYDDASAYNVFHQTGAFPLPATAAWTSPVGVSGFHIPNVIAQLI